MVIMMMNMTPPTTMAAAVHPTCSFRTTLGPPPSALSPMTPLYLLPTAQHKALIEVLPAHLGAAVLSRAARLRILARSRSFLRAAIGRCTTGVLAASSLWTTFANGTSFGGAGIVD